MEGSVAIVKKALCFFMAVVFVCCVLCHGEDERFSVEVMITNLTNFEDIPTMQDVIDCWMKPYRIYDAGDMPRFIDWYTLENTTNNGTVFVYKGSFPLAYEEDGSLTKRYDYSWEIVYHSNGTWNENPLGDPYGSKGYPIITKHGSKVFYETYEGDNELLRFFDSIKGFFLRLTDTIKVIVRILVSVFDNLQYLIPWNNTVPRGA